MAEEFDELLITTGVDALVRLVKEKQKIELDIAAKLLNIPINTIEDWAHILEEEGIIKLEYKLTKVYLLWVPATEQEIVKEKEEIKVEQKTVEREIVSLKQRIEPEIENFEVLKKSFSDVYGKIAPKMNELERTLAAITPSAKESPFVQSIEKIESRIGQLDSSVAKMKSELEGMRTRAIKPAEIKTKALDSVKNEVSSINKSLDELRTKIEKVARLLPGEMPKGTEMKKTFETLKKEVGELRKSCTAIKDDMTSLHESTDILKEMGNEITKYEEDIARLHGEIDSLVAASEELSRKSADMAERMKKDSELLERFTDTIDTAKSVLARFPTQDRLEKELESINEKEEKLAGKLDALERISEMMPRDMTTEFESLKKKVDLEKKELAAENDALVKSITEQSGIYASFQKIREKTLVSLQLYLTQIKDMNSELEKVRKQVKETEKMLEEQGKDKLKKKDLADIIKTADELRERKQTLDQLNNSFQGISENVENLRRQIDLLGKKAQFFELRGGAAPAVQPTEKEKEEIVQQIKLTKNEEEEFKKKREELRELIKKLWEES